MCVVDVHKGHNMMPPSRADLKRHCVGGHAYESADFTQLSCSVSNGGDDRVIARLSSDVG
jgi:hypothetical protein